MSGVIFTEEEINAIDEVEPLSVYEDGTEVQLTITDILLDDDQKEIRYTKKGRPYVMFIAEGPDETYKEIQVFMGVPVRLKYEKNKTGQKAYTRDALTWKEFHKAMGKSLPRELNPLEYIGEQFTAILAKRDDDYGEQNRIKSFVITR